MADQLTSEGVSYGFDASGNQTSRGSDTFSYDHENRLTQAVVGSTTSSFGYDGDGLRVSQTVGATTTSYTWDINRGLPVVLQDGTNSYVYGRDLISATDGAGNQTYFLTDGLGSTTELTDSTGAVQATYTYDAFGAVRSKTGTATTDWQFTGEQQDAASGLTYLRARSYDPATGRFLSRDPYPGAAFNPSSLHRYVYVANNPVNLVHPSGLTPAESDNLDLGASACSDPRSGLQCYGFQPRVNWDGKVVLDVGSLKDVCQGLGMCARDEDSASRGGIPADPKLQLKVPFTKSQLAG